VNADAISLLFDAFKYVPEMVAQASAAAAQANYNGNIVFPGGVKGEFRRGSRVVRGGSWASDPGVLRSADRFGFESSLRGSDVGFRVARPMTQ
jgi:formylglycine-generating enzyme required for sulfatase activity